MVTNIQTLISHLHVYGEQYQRPVADLIEDRNLSKEIPRLEKISKDLQSHQWKKVGLYIAASALVVTTAVLAVLFFKLTLPYIIAHIGMGVGDALGIMAAGHISATILPLTGLKPIYDRLTVDSKIERLKIKHEELKGRIDVSKIRQLREFIITRKKNDEAMGYNVNSLKHQIKAIDELLSDRPESWLNYFYRTISSYVS